jgi:histone H3/H4
MVAEQKPAKRELSRAAVARIVKKNGVERIGPDAVEAILAKTEVYVGELTKKAMAAASHAGRKIIRKEDIDFIAGA